MLFPVTALLFFLLLYILYDYNLNIFHDKDFKVVLFLISFVILQLLRIYCQASFPDIPNYRDIFNEIKPLTFVIRNNGLGLDYYDQETKTQVDLGFRLFISIFKVISSSYSLFLFFVSFIELWTFSFFCKKFKISLFLVMPVYIALTYTAFQIGMLRQALSFCLFLLSLCYVERKFVYFLIVALGCFIHKSMIFCAFLFWCNMHINMRFINLCFIISLIVYLARVNYVEEFWNYLALDYLGRVNYYLDNGVDTSFLGIGFWERVILYVLVYLSHRKFLDSGKQSPQYTLFFNLSVSLIIFQLFFFASPTITSRLRYYIVLFPLLYLLLYIRDNIHNKKFKAILHIPLALYLLMYIFTQSGYLRGL